MKKKIYFYTTQDTRQKLKEVTKSLFCDDYSKYNQYIWESNKNMDNIPNEFWLSNKYSYPQNAYRWYIPVMLESKINNIEPNEEGIKYITWNIKNNEINYKLTLIDYKKNKKENTIFSHYRQLTHFKKQPNWNLYDKYKSNNKVFEIKDGQEYVVFDAYHPVQVKKMKLMENLKIHEELQEDLFNAWQTPVFISNPYK